MRDLSFAPPIYQAIPLSPDDKIQCDAISYTKDITVIIEGTAIDLSGVLVPYSFSININTSVTLFVRQFALGYKFLLSITARIASGVVPDGDCYVRLSLVRSLNAGTYPHRMVLAQGYCGTRITIGYSTVSNNGYPGDHYFINNIILPDPGAESPVTFACPDFTRMELISFTYTLTTSAVVADRLSYISFSLSAGIVHNYQSGRSQSASLSLLYTLSPFVNDTISYWTVPTIITIPKIILEPGATLTLGCSLMDDDDAFTNIGLLTKRSTIPFA